MSHLALVPSSSWIQKTGLEARHVERCHGKRGIDSQYLLLLFLLLAFAQTTGAIVQRLVQVGITICTKDVGTVGTLESQDFLFVRIDNSDPLHAAKATSIKVLGRRDNGRIHLNEL